MSDDERTEAEMKIALDKVNEVIAEIGSKDVTTLTIGDSVVNGITTPLSSMVSIASEGGAGVADTLATIGVSNIDKGRMVILQHADFNSTELSGPITITHGDSAGAIEMKDSMDFILCSKRMLGLIYTGATGRWQEVWRSYGRETAAEKLAERDDMGLGTASVEDIATSAAASKDRVLKVETDTNLETDDILKINSSGQIVKATITELGGGNAATLETHDAASFVRTNESSAQSIDADLTVVSANANLIADGTSTAALRLKASGGANERAFVEMTTSDGELVIGTQTAAGGGTPSIRLNPGGAADEKLEYAVDGSTWQSLTPGAGNGLNADLLDGNEWSDVVFPASQSFRRIYFHDGIQYNLAYTGSLSGSIITKFQSMAYPVPPNGVRRFMINARFLFRCHTANSTDRDVGTKLYSADDGGSSQSGLIPNTSLVKYTYGQSYYGEILRDVFVTPGAGESVTVRCSSSNASLSSMWSDYGVGYLYAIAGPELDRTGIAANRRRCFVEITYVDEG
jgi:hypothetical protein